MADRDRTDPSNRPHPCLLGSARGITLIEVIVSTIIAAMIFLALGNLFTHYLKILKMAYKNIDMLIELREGLDKMSKEVRAALPALDPFNSGTVHAELKGTASILAFNCVKASSAMSSSGASSDIVEIGYSVLYYHYYQAITQDHFYNYMLQRTLKTQTQTLPLSNVNDKITHNNPVKVFNGIYNAGDPEVTESNLGFIQGVNIRSLSLEYGDASSLGSSTWTTSAATPLPELIRIKMAAINDQNTAIDTLTIMVRPYCWNTRRFE